MKNNIFIKEKQYVIPTAYRCGLGGWKWWIEYILAVILLGVANWLIRYA